MNTFNSCPSCKSTEIYEYKEVAYYSNMNCEIIPGVRIRVAPIVKFFQCNECKIIFQNPQMSDNELEVYYSKGYYRQMINATEDAIDKDELDRAKCDSEIIRKYIGEVNKHLDIGCSRGFLLNEVDAKVKTGVETNTSYVTTKGVRIYSDIKKVPKSKYDLITVIHVLEHLSDPFTFINKVVGFIANDGYLFIEVPTWNSPGGTLKFAHLYHFEPEVLKKICENVGLEAVDTKFTPHLMMILRLKNSFRHSSNPQ